MKYDYLIVGSGLFGATFAYEVSKLGNKCLVIDKRKHLGGNIYTEKEEGIQVHKYGPHIFHTDSEEIWKFVKNFASFNSYSHRPKACVNDKIFSLPINLMTLYQLWGVKTPEEAKMRLDVEKIKIENPNNLEEWALSQVGEDIYKTFYQGYTKKLWGKDPKDLPASIIKRLPIRLNFDDSYYFHKHQGIPVGGYTQIIEGMLAGIEVKLNFDFSEIKGSWHEQAKKLVFTGRIDEFFDYEFGELEYRTLEFKQKTIEGNFQGVSQVNYPDENIPYTRIIEHKHFEFGEQENTIITREYPRHCVKSDVPMYPVINDENNRRYEKYKAKSDATPNFIGGGRLFYFKYLDMHQVIASAINAAKKEKN